MSADHPQPISRSGFVALLGRPNAGKSTLVNRLVGSHVAIVSPIAQTTRRPVRAVLEHDGAQIVLVDLPGSQRPLDRLTARMQASVVAGLGDTDAVVWVVDMSQEPRAGERKVADLAFGAAVPVLVAANKVDLVKPALLAQRISQLSEIIGERDYAALVPISAVSGDGVGALVDELAALMPEGPAYFPPDQRVDMAVRQRIEEYVREAVLGHAREELPHATTTEVVEMEQDDETGRLFVECIIWVERDSQVGLLVGKAGSRIRDIGIAARRLIEHELQVSCHLDLRVKVRRRWRDDDVQLGRWGL